MKIITILGTRPEIIKLSPVIDILENEVVNHIKFSKGPFLEHKLIHTGQHYDSNMDKVFFEELNLCKPDYTLNVGSHPPGKQTALMLEKVEEILVSERKDRSGRKDNRAHENSCLVVVLGDTNTALAGALAAAKLHIPLMHIEAGCRSFNRQMPEEINRVIADHIADYLIVPDEKAAENLKKEGIAPEKQFLLGSTIFDAVLRNKKFVQENLTLSSDGQSEKLTEELEKDNFVLVTLHRAENTDNVETLRGILQALNDLSERITLVFPAHPRTKKIIETKSLKLSQKIKLIEPQPYLSFLALLLNCKFCLSDSGGIQEEALACNVPCLILRNETEWTRIVDAGKNFLVGTAPEKIISAAVLLLDNKDHWQKIRDIKYDYDSGAARKIVDLIKQINLETNNQINNLSINNLLTNNPPATPTTNFIHPSAEVSPHAKRGNNIKIWHHSQVREMAQIGDNCTLGKNVYVDKNVSIGQNCKIQNNSSLYHGTVLEDGVFIGPHCILTNDRHPRAIGCDGQLKTDADWTEGKILVKEGASLGARTVVLPDITLGKFALVGAGSVVTKDVPDFCLVYGNPARLRGYVCKCGQRLEDDKKAGEDCKQCIKIYFPFYSKAEQFVINSFTKIGRSSEIKHLERTVYWLKELKANADEALLISAIAHDIERAFRKQDIEDKKHILSYANPEFFRLHEERGAEIIAEFLEKEDAEKKLIERVKILVARHEEGGDDGQNLLKDADSISFFENNIPLFLAKHVSEVGKEKVKEKFDWMFNRITSEKAKQIVQQWYEEAMEKLNHSVANQQHTIN